MRVLRGVKEDRIESEEARLEERNEEGRGDWTNRLRHLLCSFRDGSGLSKEASKVVVLLRRVPELPGSKEGDQSDRGQRRRIMK